MLLIHAVLGTTDLTGTVHMNTTKKKKKLTYKAFSLLTSTN